MGVGRGDGGKREGDSERYDFNPPLHCVRQEMGRSKRLMGFRANFHAARPSWRRSCSRTELAS